MSRCPHILEAKDIPDKRRVCEDCIKTGDSWVHLRLCMSCGHVGCCDSSKNRHATKHYHTTKHPMMRSMEPGEEWGWCFVDELMFDLSDGVRKAEVVR
jgi:uncharacterized UBP type Zn finger protein